MGSMTRRVMLALACLVTLGAVTAASAAADWTTAQLPGHPANSSC
jgi:hypothetical protein